MMRYDDDDEAAFRELDWELGGMSERISKRADGGGKSLPQEVK